MNTFLCLDEVLLYLNPSVTIKEPLTETLRLHFQLKIIEEY